MAGEILKKYEIISDEWLGDDVNNNYKDVMYKISHYLKHGHYSEGENLEIDKGMVLYQLNKINLISINSLNILINHRHPLKLSVWIQRYLNKIKDSMSLSNLNKFL